MTAQDDRVEKALRTRMLALLDVAVDALESIFLLDGLAFLPPSATLRRINGLSYSARQAEALTAAVLVRHGVSWDVMAGQNSTRQAVHRRLAELGEQMFERSQESSVVTEMRLEHALSVLARYNASQRRAIADEPREDAEQLHVMRGVNHWWDTNSLAASLDDFARRERQKRQRRSAT